MSFSQGAFLILFLPLTLIVYKLIGSVCSNIKWRNVWLLFVSVFFYAWGEPWFVIILVISIIINWKCCLYLEKLEGKKRQGIYISLLILDIGMLFVFKYLTFVTENLSQIFEINTIKVALPIGISFFTFQLISYVVDVYRGEEAQKSFANLALYLMMFPQLVAGPIVRYSTINHQLKYRTEMSSDFQIGVHRFVVGLEKKVLIADPLAQVVEYMFSATIIGQISVTSAWLGAIAYTLEIYYDFRDIRTWQ